MRQVYGKDVRIEFLQFHRTKPTIINDKHARTALAIGYAKYAENIVANNKDAVFTEKISNIYKLAKYDEILRDVNTQTPKFITEEDSLEEWREFEIENRLKTVGLMSKRENLDPQLAQDLNKRKSIEKNIFSELASTLILWDIFKYYLTTSQDRRRRYGGPFPYLRNEIDRQQRKIFEHMNKVVVNILKNSENEKIIELQNMDLLLNKKFNFEKNIKGSRIKVDYVALGAAIISSNCNIPISISARTFNVSEVSVKKEINNIKTFKKPKTYKSKKFLEMIKQN
jgi:Zn-finger domain-containing protein